MDHALNVDVGPRLPLVPALQSNVQYVGSSVVLRTDLLGQIQQARRASGSGRAGLMLTYQVVLQTPLPDASVGVVSGSDGVDGVDVPLPASRYLGRFADKSIKTGLL